MELPVIEQKDGRRDFLVKALGGLGITLCYGAITTLLDGCESFEKKNPVQNTQGSGIVELDTTTIPEFATIGKGIKRVLKDTKAVDVNNGYPVIITKVADNEFVALTSLCTHEACYKEMEPPDPDKSGEVFCGCHSSYFNHKDGAVLQGPATKPLQKFPASYDATSKILTITFT